jgi:hypothetical protein
MQGIDVVWLNPDAFYVVGFRLPRLPELVPTERSVIVRLEMLPIQLNRAGIVTNGRFKIPQLPIREPSIMVEIRLVRVQANGLTEITNGGLKVSLTIKRDASVVIGKGVLWVLGDCCGVVLDGKLVLVDFVVSKRTVEERLEVPRLCVQSLRVERNGFFKLPLLARSIPHSVHTLRLLILYSRFLPLLLNLRWLV